MFLLGAVLEGLRATIQRLNNKLSKKNKKNPAVARVSQPYRLGMSIFEGQRSTSGLSEHNSIYAKVTLLYRTLCTVYNQR